MDKHAKTSSTSGRTSTPGILPALRDTLKGWRSEFHAIREEVQSVSRLFRPPQKPPRQRSSGFRGRGRRE